ncbi:MAG TPA: VWA domain-containing protein [Pyrinomonadaceae bacterium]|nr:VWA domain-containing protein [Pyrinomonadaceae bacterium]
MKNLAAVVMITGMLALSLFGQSSTATRPRVAPTPTPPVIANDQNRNVPAQAPPVLSSGRNRPTASASATPPAAGDDDGVIRVETNLVTMPVSVLDRDGRFISGLQQSDFKIFENGVEQKVDYFQSVEQPFTVVLMLDVSPSTQFRIDEIQNAAISFVDQLRPGDRVMVIAFDENVHVLSPPTNNRYQLRNAIRQAQFGDGTGLYEAVDFVIYQELQRIEGRKAVVLFSDGVDTTSRRASYESTLRSTEEIDALFYTVRYDTQSAGFGGGGGYPSQRRRRGGLGDILGAIILGGSINIGGGGGGSSAEYARGRQYLQLLAQNSGGRPFEADSSQNLDIAFRGIAEELRRQYSLGYYPEQVGRIGDRKQIKIRVMRPGVVVRAKNSYIVGQSNRNLAGR